MPVSFAVAIALFMRKYRGKSRLQQYQQQLTKKDPKEAKLVQYPTKKLVMMCALIAVVLMLGWFQVQIAKEIIEKHPIISAKRFQPQTQSFNLGFFYPIKDEKIEQYTLQTQLERFDKTIYFIQSFLILITILLALNLSLRIVRICKSKKSIQSVQYSYFGFKKRQQNYKIVQGDKLVIRQIGESRFTNNNYYFSVRIANKSQYWQVIKRADMFTARKNVLQISHILGISFSTKVTKK